MNTPKSFKCYQLNNSDATNFIESQKSEIDSFIKFKVMDVHPIEDFPPHAELLRSIWSYRKKRLPNGVLLNFNS